MSERKKKKVEEELDNFISTPAERARIRASAPDFFAGLTAPPPLRYLNDDPDLGDPHGPAQPLVKPGQMLDPFIPRATGRGPNFGSKNPGINLDPDTAAKTGGQGPFSYLTDDGNYDLARLRASLDSEIGSRNKVREDFNARVQQRANRLASGTTGLRNDLRKIDKAFDSTVSGLDQKRTETRQRLRDTQGRHIERLEGDYQDKLAGDRVESEAHRVAKNLLRSTRDSIAGREYREYDTKPRMWASLIGQAILGGLGMTNPNAMRGLQMIRTMLEKKYGRWQDKKKDDLQLIRTKLNEQDIDYKTEMEARQNEFDVSQTIDRARESLEVRQYSDELADLDRKETRATGKRSAGISRVGAEASLLQAGNPAPIAPMLPEGRAGIDLELAKLERQGSRDSKSDRRESLSHMTGILQALDRIDRAPLLDEKLLADIDLIRTQANALRNPPTKDGGLTVDVNGNLTTGAGSLADGVSRIFASPEEILPEGVEDSPTATQARSPSREMTRKLLLLELQRLIKDGGLPPEVLADTGARGGVKTAAEKADEMLDKYRKP